ncbi:MAG: NAD(P)/FAD-dependent oxidoreductase [Planctomycetes bacterium]|nr:NAD(P)/FAD-dependent oxidoreductase [Planctomycetota bacterium]
MTPFTRKSEKSSARWETKNFPRRSSQIEERQERTASSEPRILVIGAGMSGILLVIKLREAGFHNVTVFEKGSKPGGTWRDNTYPGLKCDVPAHMFTYSFAPNPDYSHRFPQGKEIQDYLLRVFQEHDVGSAVIFNRTVESCVYEDGFWYVQTQDGDIQQFDVVISATGILHTPKLPEIEGRESFRGVAFHTARWDHSIRFEGKKIGVIGTGSTSVQLIPELVAIAEHVSLFQRTPQWIFPMPNKTYSSEEKEAVALKPGLARRLRERYSKIFQWTFARAVVGNRFLLWGIEAICRRNLRRKVADPGLRKRLTPSYRAGCKRLIFAKGFYEAIQRDNATLVDTSVTCIEPNGIRTSDGRLHELDILIYATGFEAHNYMRPMVVRGRDGVSLDDTWANGAFAHRSTSIPGFPNFFMLFGPHSPIGNYSAISVAEVQCNYILRQMCWMRETNNDLIEADLDATNLLQQKVKEGLSKTVWVSGCASWYMDDRGNVPMWPWTFERFESELSKLHTEEFHISKRKIHKGFPNSFVVSASASPEPVEKLK